jgi:hypothetical protein
MDGEDANRVVQAFDEMSLRFLSDRLPEIISILQPKYRTGIPFVAFQTFFNEYVTSVMDSGDYLAGYQQKSGKEVLTGIRQILDQMADKQTIEEVKRFISGKTSAVADAIKRDIQDLTFVIPTRQELEKMMSEKDAITRERIQKQLSDALEEIPTRQQIQSMMIQIYRSQQMGDDIRQQELLSNLHQIMAVKPEIIELIQSIKDEVSEDVAEQLTTQLASQTRDISLDSNLRRAEEAEFRRQALGLPVELKAELLSKRKPASESPTKADKMAYINELCQYNEITLGGKGDFLRSIIGQSSIQTNTSYEKMDAVIEAINKRITILSSVAGVGENPAGTFARRRTQGQAEEVPDVQGSGLRRSKGRGVSGRGILIDTTEKGVMENPNRYVPFGRFHINTHRLNDDIINLKRHTGCNVDGFPVRRVSKDFGNVIRTIVGGGHPEYRQLEKLDDEEKLYLNQLVKKSNIQDRLSIPTPNRDDDEKDIHQYEVMKGEILSGNDSFDMVKKFKILIRKLMRKELLPKNQAKDILLDLATKGY